MIFKVFQSISLPYTIINFYVILWNYLLILKVLIETLLRISFSVIGRCTGADLSLAAGKMREN